MARSPVEPYQEAYERGLEDSRANTREIIAEIVELVRAEMHRHENGTTCVVLAQVADRIEREFGGDRHG